MSNPLAPVKFKSAFVIFIFFVCTIQVLSQSIVVVPNQTAASYTFSYPVNFNNQLYIDHEGYLAACNGNSVTHLLPPDGLAQYNGMPIVYNNKLYLQYATSIGTQLAVYDGTAITIINNPEGTLSYIGTPIVYKNKLYVDFIISSHPYTVELFAFDGSSFTPIPNPQNKTIQNQMPPIVYNDKLYLVYYRDSSGYPTHAQIGECDGEQVNLIPNPDNNGTSWGKFIVYNNKLFFEYASNGHSFLSFYNGTGSISIIPNPDADGHVLFGLLDQNDFPIIYNNKLYVAYQQINANTVLGEYNDTSLKLIQSPGEAQLPQYSPNPVVYNDSLYFDCILEGVNTLSKFNGNTINIISNPSSCLYNNLLAVYHDNLYLGYVTYPTEGSTRKYNGDTLSVVPDSNSGHGFVGHSLVVNDTLFFGYVSPDYRGQLLAYISTGVLAAVKLNLSGIRHFSNVVLTWQAIQKEGAVYFNVQRSTDGVSFTTISKTSVGGNSDGVKTYAYVDADINALNRGNLFYRIGEVDKDGGISYSNTVVMKATTNDAITIYPNPVSDVIDINPMSAGEEMTVSIFNATGKLFMRKVLKDNNELNVQQLPAGVYYLNVSSASKKAAISFLKQ